MSKNGKNDLFIHLFMCNLMQSSYNVRTKKYLASYFLRRSNAANALVADFNDNIASSCLLPFTHARIKKQIACEITRSSGAIETAEFLIKYTNFKCPDDFGAAVLFMLAAHSLLDTRITWGDIIKYSTQNTSALNKIISNIKDETVMVQFLIDYINAVDNHYKKEAYELIIGEERFHLVVLSKSEHFCEFIQKTCTSYNYMSIIFKDVPAVFDKLAVDMVQELSAKIFAIGPDEFLIILRRIIPANTRKVCQAVVAATKNFCLAASILKSCMEYVNCEVKKEIAYFITELIPDLNVFNKELTHYGIEFGCKSVATVAQYLSTVDRNFWHVILHVSPTADEDAYVHDLMMEVGKHFTALGDDESAIKYYEQILLLGLSVRGETLSPAFEIVSAYYMKNKKYKRLEQCLIATDLANAEQQLSDLYFETMEFEKMIESCNVLLKYEVSMEHAYGLLIAYYTSKAKIEDAINYYNLLVQYRNRDTARQSAYIIGNYFRKVHNESLMLYYYEQSMTERAVLELADYYFKTDRKRAISYYLTCPDPHYKIAMKFKSIGNGRSMVEYLKAAESSAESEYELAVYYLHKNRKASEAEEHIEKAHRLGHKTIAYEVGVHYLNVLVNSSLGIKYLTMAAEIKNADAVLALANYHYEGSNYLEAKNYYATYVHITGDERVYSKDFLVHHRLIHSCYILQDYRLMLEWHKSYLHHLDRLDAKKGNTQIFVIVSDYYQCIEHDSFLAAREWVRKYKYGDNDLDDLRSAAMLIGKLSLYIIAEELEITVPDIIIESCSEEIAKYKARLPYKKKETCCVCLEEGDCIPTSCGVENNLHFNCVMCYSVVCNQKCPLCRGTGDE